MTGLNVYDSFKICLVKCGYLCQRSSKETDKNNKIEYYLVAIFTLFPECNFFGQKKIPASMAGIENIEIEIYFTSFFISFNFEPGK